MFKPARSPFLRGASAASVPTTSSGLRRTANLPTYNQFTFAGWVRRDASGTGTQDIFGIANSTSSPSAAYQVSWNTATLRIDWYIGGNGSASFTRTPAVGEPFFLALTASPSGAAAVLTAYCISPDGTAYERVTSTAAASTLSIAALNLGNQGWSEAGRMSLWGVRLWDATLTVDEILREWANGGAPCRTRNLNAWWPLEGNPHQLILDRSGNSRPLSIVGSTRAGRFFLPPHFVEVNEVKGKAPAAGGTHPSTGALSAGSATVSGTAAHLALHPSTGALSAQAATVSGTATRFRAHPSTGTLSAQSASAAGTATRFKAHPSTGALSAQAATATGTALRFRAHPSTGALSAQAAALAGTAAHLTLHASTGALSAQAATLAGTANRGAPVHASTGTLSAAAATVAGAATRFSAHPATGALSAQSAILAGTAAHATLHAATGALSAQAAAVAGTATHATPTLHDATGALVAGSATVRGRDVEPAQTQHAGRSKGKRHRYIARYKGEDYEFSSIAELEQFVDDKREEQAAKPKKARAPVKITLTPDFIEEIAPVIEYPRRLEHMPTSAAMAQIRRIDNTLAKLLADARRAADEEDEELCLMCIM